MSAPAFSKPSAALSLRQFQRVALLILVLLLPLTVQAQSSNLDKLGVTVSPVIDEFTAKPDTTLQRTIKVTNPVRDVTTLYPTVLNFTTDNDQGQPKFYSLNERSSRYAISDWISFSKPFIRVAPGEFEQFTYTVKVPTDAEPGGHYGAVLFSTEPPKVQSDSSQVSVVGLIGTLVLATVPGDIVQKTSISLFSAPRLLIRPPANFSITFANQGNVHTKPTGEIRLRNMFGNVVSSLKVNDGLSNVLPESSRKFDVSWAFDWKQIGKYTATALVTYGTPEQQLTDSRTFYIIPIWFIVALAVLILLIAGWLIRRKRRQRHTVTTVPLPPTKPPRYVMR